LLESLRAQRRLSIKQKREEEKSLAQMPVVASTDDVSDADDALVKPEHVLEGAGGGP